MGDAGFALYSATFATSTSGCVELVDVYRVSAVVDCSLLAAAVGEGTGATATGAFSAAGDATLALFRLRAMFYCNFSLLREGSAQVVEATDTRGGGAGAPLTFGYSARVFILSLEAVLYRAKRRDTCDPGFQQGPGSES